MVGAQSRNDKPWCATKVDDNGVYISESWGTCGTKCPFEKGKYYKKGDNERNLSKFYFE